jgi:RNA polymerase sigma-70 factor (ECF subfamily)
MLLDQYGGAVRRYLLGTLRNEDAADEVFQEFALKFVRGDFEKANPDKGRFRQFVKTVVYRLVVDHQRKRKKDRRHKDLADVLEDFEPTVTEQMEAEFTSSWRGELLARAWTELEQVETKTGKPYYTVLRFRADNPKLRSPDIAAALTATLGREIKAGNARVLVHRAREIFAERLLDLVAESLQDRSDEELESELITLDLFAYCRPALDARNGKTDA